MDVDAIDTRARTIGLYLISFIAITTSLFHLYTGAFGIFGGLIQRSIHVYLLAALTFAIVPYAGSTKWRYRTVDIVLIVLSFVSMGYVLLHYFRMLNKVPWVEAPPVGDWIIGIISVLLVLEATRRIVGRLLAAVVVVFLLATYFAYLLPPPFTTPAVPPSNWIDGLFVTSEGLWGIPTRVSATFIFLFVVLAAFLESTKAGQFLIDIGNAMVGHLQGGYSKVSVVASSIFGSLSGSAAANVYGTGIFTIPMMKKSGLNPISAGSTEVTASCGGQLMPPIMGAGAFIMAQFLGINYVVVAMAAIIPSFLYYTSVYFSVHAEAVKQKIEPIPKEDRKKALNVIREAPGQALTLTLTLLVLIYMLVRGYTIYRSVFVAIGILMIVSSIQPGSRMGVKHMTVALDKGARNATQIAMACAAASIVLGSLNITGLGVVFGQFLVGAAGGVLWVLLIMVAAFSIILGFGMPTTAAYILAASLLAPALAAVDLGGLPSHFYIFTFAVYSTLTPPVALAAFAAGQVADADPIRIAFKAIKMVLPTFIIPVRYVLHPAILLEMSWQWIVLDFGILFVAVIAIQSGLWGWPVKGVVPRTLAVVGSILLILPATLLPVGFFTLIVAGLILVGFAAATHMTVNGRQAEPV
ncbi:TRAP transporter permease [Halosolutus halophilus]|uniref:TRAP transporter permease n=1 Tax=Halosolutus halophilus TaxID=1552990 RepID=UPI00223529A7|nr:TRAP transporter fused permease subunit [Halosolutus halophilus]